MNPTTKAVIMAALENDSSLNSDVTQSVLNLLEGHNPSPVRTYEGPVLLTAGAAAKRLGVSRTTFWRLVRQRQVLPVEITPGVFRYPALDIDSMASRKSRYRPRRRGRSDKLKS